MAEKLSFAKGELIFREGDWDLCMYDILSGRVGIYANYGEENQQLLTELTEGKFFGEMGLIEYLVRSATAVALEDTAAMRLNKDDFSEYFRHEPDKIMDVFRNLTGRLRTLSDQYLDACRTIAEYVEQEPAADEKPGLWKRIRKLMREYNEYEDHEARFSPGKHTDL